MNLRHTAERLFTRYDGPSPEAIRAVAARHDLSVERLAQACVLDPYFYS